MESSYAHLCHSTIANAIYCLCKAVIFKLKKRLPVAIRQTNFSLSFLCRRESIQEQHHCAFKQPSSRYPLQSVIARARKTICHCEARNNFTDLSNAMPGFPLLSGLIRTHLPAYHAIGILRRCSI